MQTIYERLDDLVKNPIPIDVKFIRLGRTSRNASYCIKESKIMFGFGTATNIEFWNTLKDGNIPNQEIKAQISSGEKSSVAFRQVKAFFEDEGDTLWVTSLNRSLYFGFSDGGNAEVAQNGEVQKSMKFGWVHKDRKGKVLEVSSLNGGITKTLSYQSTMCNFSPTYAELLVNRILCAPSAARSATENAYNCLTDELEGLIRTFKPRDFELLIELIISRAGLKRIGVAGKQEETVDLELCHPITNERLVVQVKSETSQNELEEYIRNYKGINDNVQGCKMIYAYHTGKIQTAEPNVIPSSKTLGSGFFVPSSAVNTPASVSASRPQTSSFCRCDTGGLSVKIPMR